MSRVRRATAALLEHIQRLKPTGSEAFVGESVDLGWGRVYGGQSTAQAVRAAHLSTEDGRVVHSVSTWFARPGRVDAPIEYRVEALHDGGSLSTRAVDGFQEGSRVVASVASLASLGPSSFEHRRPLFAAARPFAPEAAPTMQELLAPHAAVFKTDRLRRTYLDPDAPFEYRPLEYAPPWDREVREPEFSYYVKFRGPVADARTHVELLAYLSDWNFLFTALRPHPAPPAAVQIATISHHLVVHDIARLRVDDHLYFHCAAPAASSGRAFVVGEYFDPTGALVASATQDGILRPRSPS